MANPFRPITIKAPQRPTLASQPGAVCVVSGNRGTYWESSVSIQRVLMAHKRIAPVTLAWVPASGGGLAFARNQAVELALGAGARWVWFVDDDLVFKPDTLQRLLAHDRDVIVPLVWRRELSPAPPYVFGPPSPIDPNTSDDDLFAEWRRECLPTQDYIDSLRGVVEMRTCGAGSALIRAEVFEALPKPWFVFQPSGDLGRASEDTWFFLRARRAGFRVWIDMDIHAGHITSAAVWPARDAKGSLYADVRIGQAMFG